MKVKLEAARLENICLDPQFTPGLAALQNNDKSIDVAPDDVVGAE